MPATSASIRNADYFRLLADLGINVPSVNHLDWKGAPAADLLDDVTDLVRAANPSADDSDVLDAASAIVEHRIG
jgi:hypothetical protein